jgi:hypothetical protein
MLNSSSRGWVRREKAMGNLVGDENGKRELLCAEKMFVSTTQCPTFWRGSFPDLPRSGVAPRTPPDAARCAVVVEVHPTERLRAA